MIQNIYVFYSFEWKNGINLILISNLDSKTLEKKMCVI